MLSTQLAQSAYGGAATPLRSARGIEYAAFARVTARLQAAAAEGVAGFPRLAAALHENRRLWTLIAADVAGDENGLPEMLRARLFWLARFTEAHSRQVLARRAGPEPLVEINTMMMRGLGGQGAAG